MVIALVQEERLERGPRLLGIRVANGDEVGGALGGANLAVADAPAKSAPCAVKKEDRLSRPLQRVGLAERLGIL